MPWNQLSADIEGMMLPGFPDVDEFENSVFSDPTRKFRWTKIYHQKYARIKNYNSPRASFHSAVVYALRTNPGSSCWNKNEILLVNRRLGSPCVVRRSAGVDGASQDDRPRGRFRIDTEAGPERSREVTSQP